MVRRRSERVRGPLGFGIAFEKEVMLTKGASPVMHVAMDSTEAAFDIEDSEIRRSTRLRADRFDEAGRDFVDFFRWVFEVVRERPWSGEDFNRARKLQSFLVFEFFGYVKPFYARTSDDEPTNYYMERQWRVIGHVPFDLDEVSRILVPPGFEDPLSDAVPDVAEKITPLA
jgi:hypothetical protein